MFICQDGDDVRGDSKIAGTNVCPHSSGGVNGGWNIKKEQYVNRDYLYQFASELATDHFMVYSGICAELRSYLGILGISNKTFQLINILSTVLGHSSIL